MNVHAPIQYRLINGESINAEEDERTFNTIQNINKGKTNNHPGHLIGNMIVRHEYKMQNKTLFEFDSDMSTTKREISRVGQKLQEIENDSLFTHDYIKKNSDDWQSHLERIADFLVEENPWWQQTDFGIQFFDFNSPKNVENPKVHHFRSASISTVINDLKTHWSSIVENNIKIPVDIILMRGRDDRVEYNRTDSSSLKEISENYDEDENLDDLSNFILVEKPDEFEKENMISVSNNSTDNSEPCNHISSSSQPDIEQPSSSSLPSAELKTKEAYAIYQVLNASSPLLERYDSSKIIAKKSLKKHMSKDLRDMQAELQILTLNKISVLRKDFRTWEQEYMTNHNFKAPSEKDLVQDKEIFDIYRRIKIGKKLLHNWNISFD